MLNTPVLFIVFNRTDTTRQVFEAIRKAKPKQLFVAADGPRPDKEGEKEKCEAVRKIATAIDWDCEVKTLFRKVNRGCGRGPAEAITWFFEHVEQGIILEDDCIPNLSFFVFCGELLKYYQNNEQIMHIGGTNSQFGKKRNNSSYYFSKYPHIWGWATWKRAWLKFQFEYKGLQISKIDKIFKNYNFNLKEHKYWINHWDIIKNGDRKDIWDIQWTFSCWLNNGITIVPNTNLISNIGFGESATHTLIKDSKLGFLETKGLKAIVHPKNIVIDEKADKFTFNNYNLLKTSFLISAKNWLSGMIPYSIKLKLKKLIS